MKYHSFTVIFIVILMDCLVGNQLIESWMTPIRRMADILYRFNHQATARTKNN